MNVSGVSQESASRGLSGVHQWSVGGPSGVHKGPSGSVRVRQGPSGSVGVHQLVTNLES